MEENNKLPVRFAELSSNINRLKMLAGQIENTENQLRINILNAKDIDNWGIITDFFDMNALLHQSLDTFIKACEYFNDLYGIVFDEINHKDYYNYFDIHGIDRVHALSVSTVDVAIKTVSNSLNGKKCRSVPFTSKDLEHIQFLIEYLEKGLENYQNANMEEK